MTKYLLIYLVILGFSFTLPSPVECIDHVDADTVTDTAPPIVLACGEPVTSGEDGNPVKSFICRCMERIEVWGMNFKFEGVDSPKTAGVPFPALISTWKDERPYKFSEEVFLHDLTKTIEPKKVTLQDGIWMGLLTIRKAGTTTIVASYREMIDSKSEPLYILPSSPSRLSCPK